MVWCFVCQCLSICSVIMAIVLSICPVSMAIVLYVFLRFIAADYPFGIVKLFLLPLDQCYCWWPICSENVISSVTFKWTSPNKKRWDNTPHIHFIIGNGRCRLIYHKTRQATRIFILVLQLLYT